MKRIALPTALVLLVTLCLHIAPAHAQLSATWVSGNGSDSANCDRPTPCASFFRAYGQTLDGGVIGCVDAGFYVFPGSPVTISKSITIDCAGTLGVDAGNTLGVSIVVNGSGVVVKLRNLSFQGLNANFTGIDFQNGAALFVEDCVIQNYTVSATAIGIRFRPSSAAQLVVTNSQITHNGNGSSGGGIVVNPQSGGTARVTLDRVSLAGNVFGVAADGTNSTAGINMTITDSTISGNSQDGIIAITPSGGAPIGVYVKNSKSVNNTIGIRSIGPNVTVRVDGSSIIGNGTGLATLNGGALLSAGNNMVQANGANGAFSGSVGLQ